jgi:hypothetical protein
VYGEYGITDRFAVELYFPFLYRQTLTRIVGTSGRVINPGDEYTGIADANVELKYNLLSSGNFVVSAGLLFGLPIGTTNGGDTQLMQSGDGEFNQRLMAYAGYSVPNTNLYFAGGAGVNNRTKDFSDSFHGQLEAGYVLGNVSFHLKSYIVQSFFNGEAATSANGIFSNNLEYISYGPEVNVNITDQLGVGASVFFASQGRSVLAAPSIGGGVFYTW